MIARRSGEYWIAVLAICLGGCNALYFAESAKVALSVEARPDASQPVQGSFGGKQRTVVVAPPVAADRESTAMISSFRFGREPKAGSLFGPIEIHTALVTGEAARSLNPKQARDAALAIAGAPIPPAAEQAREIVGAMNPAQRERARALLELPDPTEAQRKELGRLTGLLDVVDENPKLLGEVRERLGGN